MALQTNPLPVESASRVSTASSHSCSTSSQFPADGLERSRGSAVAASWGVEQQMKDLSLLSVNKNK